MSKRRRMEMMEEEETEGRDRNRRENTPISQIPK